MEPIPRISEAEWEVMELVWELGPLTAQEVAQELGPQRSWSAGTVKTLLGRLLRKGALAHEQEGRHYRYHAAVERETCVRAESESFLQKIFGGSPSPMLAHFLEQSELSEKEIRELEALLRRKKRARGGRGKR